MREQTAGRISIAIAIIIGIVLAMTFFIPNPPTLSYGAVVVGVGTIISIIVLSAALFSRP